MKTQKFKTVGNIPQDLRPEAAIQGLLINRIEDLMPMKNSWSGNPFRRWMLKIS